MNDLAPTETEKHKQETNKLGLCVFVNRQFRWWCLRATGRTWSASLNLDSACFVALDALDAGADAVDWDEEIAAELCLTQANSHTNSTN